MLANARRGHLARARGRVTEPMFRVTETYRGGAEGKQKTSALLHAFAILLEDPSLRQRNRPFNSQHRVEAELTRISQTVDVANGSSASPA